MYQIQVYPLGIYQANCYLIIKQNHALIVDPGSKSVSLLSMLKEKEIVIDAVLLTHGHFDHIAGADYFATQFNCPIYIDKDEEKLARDAKMNCSLPGKESVLKKSTLYYQNGINKIEDFEFECIYAPGHTNGSVMLRFDNFLFSGDVLFKNSIGRCDLPTGSNSKMFHTLEMLKQMDPDLIVYPGHGETTTLHEELLYNPYMK